MSGKNMFSFKDNVGLFTNLVVSVVPVSNKEGEFAGWLKVRESNNRSLVNIECTKTSSKSM